MSDDELFIWPAPLPFGKPSKRTKKSLGEGPSLGENHMTKAERERIAKALSDGLPVSRIAEEFGRDPKQVRKVYKKLISNGIDQIKEFKTSEERVKLVDVALMRAETLLPHVTSGLELRMMADAMEKLFGLRRLETGDNGGGGKGFNLSVQFIGQGNKDKDFDDLDDDHQVVDAEIIEPEEKATVQYDPLNDL